MEEKDVHELAGYLIPEDGLRWFMEHRAGYLVRKERGTLQNANWGNYTVGATALFIQRAQPTPYEFYINFYRVWWRN